MIMKRFSMAIFLFLFLTNVANAADDWTLQCPAPHPLARTLHAMAYIGGDQVLLFGGYDALFLDDATWVYDLSADTWTQQSPVSSPSTRRGHALAYIGWDQMLLFGGKGYWCL